ncbi:tyrosine-protein phosphatase [Streptomyces sp. Isolate_45]|uniref:tyrosine-protein phosphatase n=1 Tax=Streptomyces sp. Isolate_45 TaxID=2950111 RepID=UPI002481B4CF|nr:tyrosine-protein phosphatase [Streptomyces sp. Isolate_45]MDA5280935.1 tyrosine-protein phosphatase [Streptomyces sp. Isolate_45]
MSRPHDTPPSRHVAFDRLHNFRDLGGYRSADGRTVVRGALYRSDNLAKLAGDDWERFLGLGVRTVIDLRYPWEIERRGRVPQAHLFTYANHSIEHRPYDQAEIDPDTDPWRYLADRFAEVAEDGVVEIREAIELIADAPGPTVFHCASGKDRTGLIAALVLTLLDVPEEEILADFALTELATERLVADWRAAHPGRTLRWPSYGRAPATVMALVLADLTARHGSPSAYLTGPVGITPATVARLRERLLTPLPQN